MKIAAFIKSIVISASIILMVMTLTGGNAMAQKYEVNPYVGGFFAQSWIAEATLRNAAFVGARAGYYTTRNLEFDANVNYMNHFEFKGTDRANRAFLWDLNASFNQSFDKLNRVEPFVTVGLGGITTTVRGFNKNGALMLDATGLDPGLNLGMINVSDGKTFFAVNYGGGVKALRLYGPLGWRADFRNRIMPNFYGRANSWLEASGGLTFTWGER